MDITFCCPQCGQSIVIDEAGEGMELPCPTCQQPVVVPAQSSSEPVTLSQLCPTCHRAWPEPERVCDHCGTALQTPTPALEPARPEPRPPALPASAPIPPAEPASDETHYRCMSPNCGRLWSESQLEYQQIGRKKIPVCPHCRLGVSKLQKKLNFWTSAPRAFLYPFQGVGGWVVGFGAPLFALLNHVGFGVLLLFPKLAIFGFFGMMLLNVIRTTADDEEESLDWPALEGKFEFVVVGLQIIGGTLIVFGPALLCAMQAGISFLGRGGSPATPGIWAMAMLACLALGVVYYPMGLVGIAMFDSIKGLNPLLIVPAIFKVPLQYLLVLVLLAALWLTRIPAAMVANLFHFPWSLIPIIIADGIVLYTLIVSARLLGLLYRANAERIGWFT